MSGPSKLGLASSLREHRERVGVVIPTRDRPAELRRCLQALAAARAQQPFTAWVCDSSAADVRPEVERVCAVHDWVELRFHDGRSIPVARNFSARVAEAELLVSVDDDVIVAPQAVRALVETYDRGSGAHVVAGAVVWGDDTQPLPPLVLRSIGYGRPARAGERPEFLNSSLFLYPRAYGLRWPWNERMRRGSDVLMGAIWRRAGVAIDYAPDARAVHADREQVHLAHHDDYVYAVLAHMLVAGPHPVRLGLLETAGVAAGLKAYGRSRRTLLAYLRAWVRGHVAFAQDFRRLRALGARSVPPIAGHELGYAPLAGE
jgi:glycosyltransferase involved in cell wall biosynthesis